MIQWLHRRNPEFVLRIRRFKAIWEARKELMLMRRKYRRETIFDHRARWPLPRPLDLLKNWRVSKDDMDQK